MLSNEANALYEIFEKRYLEKGYLYSGMIPFNAAPVISFDYNVYHELIDAGFLQKRDCNGYAFELTVPARKKLIDENNLSEVWEADPHGRVFYPNGHAGEVTQVNKKFAALQNEKRSLDETIQSASSRSNNDAKKSHGVMKERAMTAIREGYGEFRLYDNKDLVGIDLTHGGGMVKVDGVLYDLYKPLSMQDAIKLDEAPKRHKRHKVDDYFPRRDPYR